MLESTKKVVDHIIGENPSDAKNEIESILYAKMEDALELKKIDIASSMAEGKKPKKKDDEEKKVYLKEHLKSINNHITTLSNKNYQDLDINQPDYVLMFMANEPAFKLAVLEDVSIYNKAIDKNIVMVTNSTLFATLKTVAYMWKQDKANKNAIEIARQAGSLYDKFQSFSEDLIKVGNNLNTTKNTYEDAMKKLTDGKDNLVRKTERLRELGAKTSKKINPKLVDRSK